MAAQSVKRQVSGARAPGEGSSTGGSGVGVRVIGSSPLIWEKPAPAAFQCHVGPGFNCCTDAIPT
jgi:hypothetical protein